MRNTPPIAPIAERETSDLIEDLCIALRNVGGSDYGLPEDQRGVAFIHEVQQLVVELTRRSVDTSERVQRLSVETGWQMPTLLLECMAFPEIVPYVREADSVRRAFRCELCGEREFPARDRIQLCDVCLEGTRAAILSRTPIAGVVLFRTYNESKRCSHADSETVLMTFDDEYDCSMGNSYCDQCLLAEQLRRQ